MGVWRRLCKILSCLTCGSCKTTYESDIPSRVTLTIPPIHNRNSSTQTHLEKSLRHHNRQRRDTLRQDSREVQEQLEAYRGYFGIQSPIVNKRNKRQPPRRMEYYGITDHQ
jgi:Na+-translocating ferredoxin:NAD+ oxidoreductase RnfC subunit